MAEFISEAERIERCLTGMTKVGIWLERAVRVVGAIFSVIFLVIPLMGIHAYYDPGYSYAFTLDECLSALPCGFLFAIVSFFMWRLASTLAKGESPFSLRAYRSLVAITLAFAVFALVEFVLSRYGLGGLILPPLGIVLDDSGLLMAFLSLLFAGIVGVLAFVFRYGMLLQQQSDFMI